MSDSHYRKLEPTKLDQTYHYQNRFASLIEGYVVSRINTEGFERGGVVLVYGGNGARPPKGDNVSKIINVVCVYSPVSEEYQLQVMDVTHKVPDWFAYEFHLNEHDFQDIDVASLTDEHRKILHARISENVDRLLSIVFQMDYFTTIKKCRSFPYQQSSIPIEMLEGFCRLGKLIYTQDNRITDQPLFIVQQLVRDYGYDPNYSDNFVWVNRYDPEGYHEELPEGASMDDYEQVYYKDRWEFVTACFTEAGCKEYLKKDGHNLNEPRIYAAGSYRNDEYHFVRDSLIALSVDS